MAVFQEERAGLAAFRADQAGLSAPHFDQASGTEQWNPPSLPARGGRAALCDPKDTAAPEASTIPARRDRSWSHAARWLTGPRPCPSGEAAVKGLYLVPSPGHYCPTTRWQRAGWPGTMRDTGDRPNATRYARGSKPRAPGTRRGAAPGPSAKREPAETQAAALPPSSRRELVAQKFSGFDGMTLDWSQVRDYTLATIQEALIDREVPAEHLTEPRLEVAVPAIEAMRYTGLRREFALLIAATMDTARADQAHPAFVEILKQLTLDEANLLSVLPSSGQVVPMATLYHLDRAGHVKAALRHILPEAYAAKCMRRSAIPGYIDNLMRLNLVSSPSRLKIDEERFYRDLLAQDFVSDHCARMPHSIRPSIERTVLTLTDFGIQFRNCCIDTAPAGSRALKPD